MQSNNIKKLKLGKYKDESVYRDCCLEFVIANAFLVRLK
jgi:hypothetical protein